MDLDKYCFAGDTLVATESALKRIDSVAVEEKVWAFDFAEGTWQSARVLHRHQHTYHGPVVRLTGVDWSLTCTAKHPIWVVSGDSLATRPQPEALGDGENVGQALKGRWVNSDDLQVGDVQYSREHGPREVATKEISADETLEVYNLTVEGYHTFAVSDAGLLVHNEGFCHLLLRLSTDMASVRQQLATHFGKALRYIHGHHIVQKKVPKQFTGALAAAEEVGETWTKSEQYAWFVGKSQQILEGFDIPIIESVEAGRKLLEESKALYNLCFAPNGFGTHSLSTVKFVWEKLSKAKTQKEAIQVLDEIREIFHSGRIPGQ